MVETGHSSERDTGPDFHVVGTGSLILATGSEVVVEGVLECLRTVGVGEECTHLTVEAERLAYLPDEPGAYGLAAPLAPGNHR